MNLFSYISFADTIHISVTQQPNPYPSGVNDEKGVPKAY
jgi:hypothetical protein